MTFQEAQFVKAGDLLVTLRESNPLISNKVCLVLSVLHSEYSSKHTIVNINVLIPSMNLIQKFPIAFLHRL